MRRRAAWVSARRANLVDRLDAAVLRRVRTLNERAGRDMGRRRDEVLAVMAAGVAGLTDPVRPGSEWPLELRRAIVDQFHRLYYDDGLRTWQTIRYRGHGIWKCPFDLWMYQELVDEIRPGLIVETGTALGGSGLFLADLCELVGAGRVVTIDVRERAPLVDHPRLTKLIGSSSNPAVFAEVAALAPSDEPVLVILDSDHSREHVLAELRLWAPLVTTGSYIVVEDTNINGHPVFASFGPGPMEAVNTFLAGTDDFEVDPARERLLMTWNPGGYLRRVAGSRT